ncbi:peptidoglycan-associated lipoprotein Pal [Hydromonas duriensis]|uniref:Peptidoglycan-associated lipoprotein n=1 Tax=Hydromonas duriensis TaxID=1527608 RepID=A0A4R6YBY8_9BURK|nr:peptidoglycan-associated lipoprotein Pal [Hydromonas duriensis]TDR33172.1 peptidoglycan-associated lipoprotein [Hydromonas duriensis]
MTTFKLTQIPLMLISISLFTACATKVPLDGSNQNTVKTVDVTNGIGADGVPAPAARSVYFDLDSYIVRADGQPVINSHAKFLQDRRQRIIIQGNTDERGTAEYNLALGQKRSEAVRQALKLQGVNDEQMEAVSLGKEKPKALGSNENAWAENRRADIVY